MEEETWSVDDLRDQPQQLWVLGLRDRVSEKHVCCMGTGSHRATDL